jgi:copper transport protein
VARRPAAVALALVLIPAALGAGAPSAGAHARLVHVSPADGATLPAGPRALRLRFSEAVSERFRRVALVDGRGRAVAGTRLRRGDGDRELVLDVPRLRRGTYQVGWEVLGQDDGHVTGGAVVFGVGTRPGAAPRGTSAPGSAVAPPAAALPWLDLALLCAITGAIGVLAVLLGLGPRAPPGVRGAVARLAGWSAVGALAVGLALLARQVHDLRAVRAGTGAADVLGVRWGWLWLAREALLAVVAGVVLVLGPARRAVPVAGAAVAGLVLVHVLGGHAAAGAHPGVAVAVAAVHLLGAGLWLGGVAALAVALAAAGPARGALARALRGPFAWLAGGALGALAITGLLQAGAQVASVDALLTTDYGTTLIIKMVLVAATAALGLANARMLRRGTAPRALAVEAAAGLGVLLAAAVLAASPPAKGPEFAAPRAVVAPTLVRQAGDLLVTAAVRPNRPGPNVVTVLAASSRRPAPAPVRRVAVRLAPRAGGPARTVVLGAVGGDRFAGAAELSDDGAWTATVLLDRAGRRLTVPVAWRVEPPDPARPVVHSARRLAPLLQGAAAALALALLAATAGALLARRRRPAGHAPVATARTTSVPRMPAR